MEDFDDDVAVFAELKTYCIQKREQRAKVNIEQLHALSIPAIEQSKNVFRVNTSEGAVMYYPPSGKWQHRGRVIFGKVEDFQNWLRKKGFIS